MAGPSLAVLGIKVENGEVVKATASLDKMTVAGSKTEAAAQRLSRRMGLLEIQAREMDASLEAANRSSFRLAGGLGGLTGALQAVAGALFVRELVATADAYTGLHARLGLVTTDLANLARVEAELFAISQQTRTGLESNVALYASLARSTKSLGLSQADLLTITKATAESFIVSGASVMETENAVRQLGQAFASGRLQADEFRSISENAPRLQAAVAASMHVTVGELKALSTEGKITGAVLAKALLEGAKDIQAEFDKMPVTVGGAMTRIHNAILLYVGTANQASGASSSLADGLSLFAEKIPTILNWIGKLAEGYGFLATVMATAATAAANLVSGNAGLNPSLLANLKAEWKALMTAPTAATLGGLNAGGPPGPPVLTPAQLAAIKKQHEANQDLIRDAEQAADLAGLEGPAQERVRIAYEASNKVFDAQRRLKGELLAETIKAIEAEEKFRFAGVARAEAMKAEKDAIATAKKDLDQFEDDITSKLSKSLAKVFGQDNPLRGLFESLTKDLLRLWITRFIEPAVASMFALDMSRYGRGSLNDISNASVGTPGMGAAAGGAFAGLAGLGTGYGIGGALYNSGMGRGQNNTRGALGGAAGGAAMGALMGSVIPGLGTAIGAVIGGAAGAIGGLLGIGSAAKQAAKQMADAQATLKISMQGLRATVSGDQLGVAIAQIEAEREKYRRDYEDAYAGGKNERERYRLIGEMNALENKRIQMLRDEYALKQQYATEDLEARKLRAEGHTSEADALTRKNAADREIAQAIADHRSDEYIATLRYVTGLELATNAMDKAGSAALNMVSGYKYQAAFFNAMTARSGTGVLGTWPTASNATSGDLAVKLVLADGSVLGKAVIKDFARRQRLGDAELRTVLS